MTREPAQSLDLFRNALAAMLVMSFVACLPLLVFKTLPEGNREIVVYVIGQLSGMATTAIAFYFVQKAGQDAQDAKRTDNTSKALDAIKAAADANTGPLPIDTVHQGD